MFSGTFLAHIYLQNMQIIAGHMQNIAVFD